ALAIAAPAAFRLASSFEGYVAVRGFVFRTALYSVAAFLPPLIISSIVFYIFDQAKLLTNSLYPTAKPPLLQSPQRTPAPPSSSKQGLPAFRTIPPLMGCGPLASSIG